MSIVSQVILKADDELRYPSSGELEGIKNFLTLLWNLLLLSDPQLIK